MWVWQSIRPGSTVEWDRSTTSVPGGIGRPGPTAVMRSPSMRMTASRTGAPPVPSIRRPARTARRRGGAGCAGVSAAARSSAAIRTPAVRLRARTDDIHTARGITHLPGSVSRAILSWTRSSVRSSEAFRDDLQDHGRQHQTVGVRCAFFELTAHGGSPALAHTAQFQEMVEMHPDEAGGPLPDRITGAHAKDPRSGLADAKSRAGEERGQAESDVGLTAG